MKPEKRQLIHDLLDSQHEARREATLSAGTRILRHRRWGRAAGQTCAIILLLAIAAVSVQRLATTRAPILVTNPPPPTAPQSLTDAELLALFPDTPVGLVTLENGSRRLVFLRPSDQERFIHRL